jgi:hypothetical protein
MSEMDLQNSIRLKLSSLGFYVFRMNVGLLRTKDGLKKSRAIRNSKKRTVSSRADNPLSEWCMHSMLILYHIYREVVKSMEKKDFEQMCYLAREIRLLEQDLRETESKWRHIDLSGGSHAVGMPNSTVETLICKVEEYEIVVVESVGDGCSSARRILKKPEERDKLKSAELIGKRYGIFSDKINIDGIIPVVFAGEDKLED